MLGNFISRPYGLSDKKGIQFSAHHNSLNLISTSLFVAKLTAVLLYEIHEHGLSGALACCAAGHSRLHSATMVRHGHQVCHATQV